MKHVNNEFRFYGVKTFLVGFLLLLSNLTNNKYKQYESLLRKSKKDNSPTAYFDERERYVDVMLSFNRLPAINSIPFSTMSASHKIGAMGLHDSL